MSWIAKVSDLECKISCAFSKSRSIALSDFILTDDADSFYDRLVACKISQTPGSWSLELEDARNSIYTETTLKLLPDYEDLHFYVSHYSAERLQAELAKYGMMHIWSFLSESISVFFLFHLAGATDGATFNKLNLTLSEGLILGEYINCGSHLRQEVYSPDFDQAPERG